MTSSKYRCHSLYKNLKVLKLNDIYQLELAKCMYKVHHGKLPEIYKQGFLSRFRDPIRVPRIKENYHRVSRIRENGSLQVHTGFLTFSLKKHDIRNIFKKLLLFILIKPDLQIWKVTLFIEVQAMPVKIHFV